MPINNTVASTEEAGWLGALLRRVVKLLESNATVDLQNRQKVTVDNATPGALQFAGAGVTILGNVPTGGAPTVPSVGYPLLIWETPVDQRWRVMEESRVSYQIGIRNNLAFS